ncbi:DUF5134 domain-containing protein [Streptomyces pseudovenezuelae]|uniref:DUF5134 domain-containing protein n=1 Tax=Streptomyces pseudovenezuelae TaxID=67350 RepID=UPI0037202678
MIAASGLRWVLSLMFAVPVVYGAWKVVSPGAGVEARVDHVLHAVMGVLMIAMAWPWGMDVPVLPQVVLFAAGALWFLAAAPFRGHGTSRGQAVSAALPHVVMMGAMAWMVSAMAPSGSTASDAGPGGMHDMAGMDMSGGSGLASMSLTGAGPVAVALLLSIVLGGLGLFWLTQALDRARSQDGEGRPVQGDCSAAADPAGALAPTCHAAMALGMAAMFFLLA